MEAHSKTSLINLLDQSRAELGTTLAEWGHGDFHANRVWRYLYHQRAKRVEEMVELRPGLLSRLKETTSIGLLREDLAIKSRDGSTVKFLLALPDGQTIETVIMLYPSRATVCISTQVGCAMGCVFCATGQMGFIRHLSPGEIVAQVLHAIDRLEESGDRLRNIVLMGMGEPLHNYESTMAAVNILTDDRGLAVGPRFITISTVGIPPAIRRLAEDSNPVNLAVSLHAATDEERSAIVPVNKRWPLDQLIDACREYIAKRDRRIFFEWALISGRNDTEEQAHAVGRLLHGLEAHVNLIPLNPTAGFDGQPSKSSEIQRFQEILTVYGLPSTVRQRRGIDIDAGCGQLRTRVDAKAG